MADGYLTIQHVQHRANDVCFNDPDIVSPDVLDMHEEKYHSGHVSRITIFRWMH